ncbi:membrane protease subunit, stomatin/prohibitin [Schinkia azotoformans MEV2011]|uniref:Protein HflC n=1 Tax=Schinkia azotoformans MEV2011 TaxID=1348973 RepID=A0A072NRP7_SCHAZ|nr:protease modulator HflC [Schinkia azotoformans]KEF39563.1 membrane protease subunit, stomatin/prohibitin [Schinkia azotoformans MEV2011]MEC1637749.1 protease modulator HflC [Schinkia azotoformans]MEC1694253.1 protease modulator HflC [Schinkia azotoformans]MEC1714946.1 protease modulator HflC [Schinkia azotoformans]MEC1720451.1 protease modulator HflC [Schinkia azotoformans]
MSDKKIVNLDELKNKNIEWKKITRFGISIIIFFVLIGFILSNVFVVKEGEYKVIRQFGEVVRIIDQPGLNFKIPFIQSVQTLPKYQKFYEVQQAEINTKDKKRMLVDNYAVWRIQDPKKMISNLRTVENAEAKMSEFIFSVVRTQLGQLNYDEIIDEENSSRGSFNETVTAEVNDLLQRDNYGIIVTDIRMKRIDLPAENEESVYKRMISERETKAQEYLSMGDAEKNRIIANTDREVKELLAKAQADAEKIRAEGEQKAAQTYNDAFSKDPSFYNLFRTLESYKRTIDGETVIILPANSPYAKLLMGYTE